MNPNNVEKKIKPFFLAIYLVFLVIYYLSVNSCIYLISLLLQDCSENKLKKYFFKAKNHLFLNGYYPYKLFRNVGPNLQCLKSLLCRTLTRAMGNLVVLNSRLAFRSNKYKILAFTEALYLNHFRTKWWARKYSFFLYFSCANLWKTLVPHSLNGKIINQSNKIYRCVQACYKSSQYIFTR